MYIKSGCFEDKQNFGNQVIVYKGERGYFVVVKDREEVVYYFVDSDIRKMYPINSYIKQTGFSFHNQVKIMNSFNIDLSSWGYSDCPKHLQQIIKNIINPCDI